MTKMKFALIAHDRQKPMLLKWVKGHLRFFRQHNLCATGTTGALLEKKLSLKIEKFMSGPLGGDLQIGAQIVEGSIDGVFFFWDPLAPQPHDVDVKALLRIAVVKNIPIACNPASADLILRGLH